MIGPRTLLITQDFPPDRGGIARVYGELCRRIPRLDVSTVAGPHEQLDSGFQVHRMSFALRHAHFPINILRWTRWATRFVESNGITLVHAGNVRPTGYVAAMIRRRLGVPYIVYVHGKDLLKERRKGIDRWMVRVGTREILGNAAAIVANSTTTAELAKDLLRSVGRGNACARVHVVHPGADPARFTGAVGSQRRNAGDGPVLLSVARLVPRKGIDTVLRSLPAVLASHPTATYVVVGSGPDLTRLEQLSHSLGVATHVRFVGDVSDELLPACYAAADVFLLPTREILADDEIEGFGIVYLEAAAAGVPSIAANVGGVADAVMDGVTGLMVRPDSPASVARATLRLLDDAPLRTRLGVNARTNVERDLNWDRAAHEVMRIVGGVVPNPYESASRRIESQTPIRASRVVEESHRQ